MSVAQAAVITGDGLEESNLMILRAGNFAGAACIQLDFDARIGGHGGDAGRVAQRSAGATFIGPGDAPGHSGVGDIEVDLVDLDVLGVGGGSFGMGVGDFDGGGALGDV